MTPASTIANELTLTMTAPSIAVRAAHEGDALVAAACVKAAFEPYVERIGKPPAPMLSDYAALAAEGKVWVAELGGRVIGVLVQYETADGFYIDTVAASPHTHGTGVGRADDTGRSLVCRPATVGRVKKLARALCEFAIYIDNNANAIGNYGARYRCGERISIGFVESTVNQVVAKRFVKKQQMRWTLRGAHLLLQIRAHVLNGELAEKFRQWYPGFTTYKQEPLAA